MNKPDIKKLTAAALATATAAVGGAALEYNRDKEPINSSEATAGLITPEAAVKTLGAIATTSAEEANHKHLNQEADNDDAEPSSPASQKQEPTTEAPDKPHAITSSETTHSKSYKMTVDKQPKSNIPHKDKADGKDGDSYFSGDAQEYGDDGDEYNPDDNQGPEPNPGTGPNPDNLPPLPQPEGPSNELVNQFDAEFFADGNKDCVNSILEIDYGDNYKYFIDRPIVKYDQPSDTLLVGQYSPKSPDGLYVWTIQGQDEINKLKLFKRYQEDTIPGMITFEGSPLPNQDYGYFTDSKGTTCGGYIENAPGTPVDRIDTSSGSLELAPITNKDVAGDLQADVEAYQDPSNTDLISFEGGIVNIPKQNLTSNSTKLANVFAKYNPDGSVGLVWRDLEGRIQKQFYDSPELIDLYQASEDKPVQAHHSSAPLTPERSGGDTDSTGYTLGQPAFGSPLSIKVNVHMDKGGDFVFTPVSLK